MDIQESIEWVDDRMCFGRYTPQISNPFIKDECFIAGKMAIEALEKQDKYRWHDLRKDPEDLPQSGVDILVFGMEGGFSHYQVCTYDADIETAFEYYADHTSYYFEKPIAWKYIEPFEEGEE